MQARLIFSHLVVASGGRGCRTRVSLIIDILRSEPELFADVWAVQYVSERRWDIHMRSGLAIRLPEQDPVLAWSRLAKLEQETAITERDLAAIDLRVPGQLVVEPNIPIRGKGKENLMAPRYKAGKSPFAVIDLGSSRFACLIAEFGTDYAKIAWSGYSRRRRHTARRNFRYGTVQHHSGAGG